MDEKNLWGDLENLEELISPKIHLKNQAGQLIKLTKARLYGSVNSFIDTNGNFNHELDIVAPYLNNYHHTILRIFHGINFYPLTFYDMANDKSYSCETEEKFIEILGNVLSSSGVRSIITSLIAQSKD